MTKMVPCMNMAGKTVLVPAERLRDRPGAYGVLLHAGNVLLLKLAVNGRYFLPGGGIEPWETRTEALAREFMEETGLAIEPVRLLASLESFLYYDPADDATHSYGFFYSCRLRGEPAPLVTGDPEEGVPEWVSVRAIMDGGIPFHLSAGVVVRDFLHELGRR